MADEDLDAQLARFAAELAPATAPATAATWPQYLAFVGRRWCRRAGRLGWNMLKAYGFATYPQLTEVMLENELYGDTRNLGTRTLPSATDQ